MKTGRQSLFVYTAHKAMSSGNIKRNRGKEHWITRSSSFLGGMIITRNVIFNFSYSWKQVSNTRILKLVFNSKTNIKAVHKGLYITSIHATLINNRALCTWFKTTVSLNISTIAVILTFDARIHACYPITTWVSKDEKSVLIIRRKTKSSSLYANLIWYKHASQSSLFCI